MVDLSPFGGWVLTNGSFLVVQAMVLTKPPYLPL